MKASKTKKSGERIAFFCPSEILQQDDITRLNPFTLNWTWIIQAFKLLFSHITLSVSQQRPLFSSLPKFNRCWYPSSLFCLFCLRLKFTWTCCLAAAICFYVGVHLRKIVSSYFITGYQQSRYMKALLILHYWSNDERPCLSLFCFCFCFFHEEKNLS